jgi:3-methyladenine DNA glycosylase AlkC
LEPFKNLLSAQTVAEAGRHLQRAWPAFDRRRFETLAADGLADLEFKARAHHLCTALEAILPEDFAVAAGIIEAALGPAGVGDNLASLRTTDAGLGGWVVWPLGEFVVRRGMQAPTRALAALHALTQRFSAEYAVRPFIATHPDLAFATLSRWAQDPSAHVRRLASEGSRPRLPWGMQLKALVADPTPTLPLLRALQDDPSDYVRRSVANHLNDIAKDHPALVAEWVEEHLPGAPKPRQALLKHASRTLIKKGDARMLKAWGLGRPLRGEAQLKLSPRRASVGETLNLDVQLRSSATRAQKLVIDYAVHHVKANGETSPKVFKGWVLDLAAGEARTLRKTHSLRPITTRRYHAGRHAVELRVNGETLGRATFDLKV